MSEIVVTGLRLLLLAGLWIFILFVVNVIRTDLTEVYNPSAEKSLANEQGGKAKRGLLRRRGARSRTKRSAPSMVTVVEGKSAGVAVPLAGVVTIGRGFDCVLPIDDSYASEKHAQLRRSDDGDWVLEDLLSTNGTYVNEVSISTPCVVSESDDIRIGRTHLKLEP